MVLDESDLLYFSDFSSIDQGEIIGYSLVVVSTEIIEKAILRNQIISSIITFLVICLGVVIGYLFTNIIIRLIKSPVKANDIVATGNFTTQVEIISRDEVGLLSVSFNEMVDKIRIQQEALLDYSRTLEDKVRERTAQLAAEKAKSDNLLLNILPVSIANRLKKKEDTIADRYDEVTVLFSDLVGFTQFSAKHTPKELVYKLNILFSKFDDLLDHYKIEKIKTIGDALMLVSGAPRRFKTTHLKWQKWPYICTKNLIRLILNMVSRWILELESTPGLLLLVSWEKRNSPMICGAMLSIRLHEWNLMVFLVSFIFLPQPMLILKISFRLKTGVKLKSKVKV